MGIHILAADSNRYQNLVWATEETRKAMWARFRGLPISQNWSPVKVKVLHDEKQNKNLPPSDFPSLGGYVPTFSQRALEALGDLLIPNGEILPLISDEGTYCAFNVTTLANVLDHQRSEIKRFSDGRVMGDQGIYEGDHVIILMDRLLSRKLGKQGVTFRDLPVPCSMVVTDITYKRLLVLPQDLKDYGVDDPLSFSVAHAVRATMSIPIFFEPYRIRLRPGGQEQTVTWVDGGVLSNFPVWLFDPRGATPEIPTFGFLLREPGGAGPQPTETFLDFLKALVSTTLSAHDAHALTNQDYARTVEIDTGTVGTTEFDLAPEKRDWLYQSGRRAAEEFFHRFDFEAWLSRFSGASALPPDAPGADSTMSLTH